MTSKPSCTNCPNLLRREACSQLYLRHAVFGYAVIKERIISASENQKSAVLAVKMSSLFEVATAAGSHLFPFRTEQLSPPAPMVLQCNAGE